MRFADLNFPNSADSYYYTDRIPLADGRYLRVSKYYSGTYRMYSYAVAYFSDGVYNICEEYYGLDVLELACAIARFEPVLSRATPVDDAPMANTPTGEPA